MKFIKGETSIKVETPTSKTINCDKVDFQRVECWVQRWCKCMVCDRDHVELCLYIERVQSSIFQFQQPNGWPLNSWLILGVIENKNQDRFRLLTFQTCTSSWFIRELWLFLLQCDKKKTVTPLRVYPASLAEIWTHRLGWFWWLWCVALWNLPSIRTYPVLLWHYQRLIVLLEQKIFKLDK